MPQSRVAISLIEKAQDEISPLTRSQAFAALEIGERPVVVAKIPVYTSANVQIQWVRVHLDHPVEILDRLVRLFQLQPRTVAIEIAVRIPWVVPDSRVGHVQVATGVFAAKLQFLPDSLLCSRVDHHRASRGEQNITGTQLPSTGERWYDTKNVHGRAVRKAYIWRIRELKEQRDGCA